MFTDRRTFLSSIMAGVLATPARAQAPAMSRITAFAFHFAGLKGGDIQLAEHAGKPILIVNTASQCGYTPQYAGLQELWTRYRGRGLLIVGVPSNDFGGQEPGDADEIAETAEHEYGASFPITAKAVVNGAGAHPFYRWASAQRPLDRPRWNFHGSAGHRGDREGAFAGGDELKKGWSLDADRLSQRCRDVEAGRVCLLAILLRERRSEQPQSLRGSGGPTGRSARAETAQSRGRCFRRPPSSRCRATAIPQVNMPLSEAGWCPNTARRC
jgi:glutathione peroxidase